MMKRLLELLFASISNKLNDQNIIKTQNQIEGKKNIAGSEISGNVSLGVGCKIYKSYIFGNVAVGNYTSIWGPNTTIASHCNSINIGNFCSIARNVTIQESNHRTDTITTYNIMRNLFGEDVSKDMESKGSISIGHDVWIGANAVVLSGCSIGNGAIVASGAIVAKDIPDYAIVVGNPARVIKYRFDDESIDLLKKLKWWDWSLQKIMNNKSLFEREFSSSSLNHVI